MTHDIMEGYMRKCKHHTGFHEEYMMTHVFRISQIHDRSALCIEDNGNKHIPFSRQKLPLVNGRPYQNIATPHDVQKE